MNTGTLYTRVYRPDEHLAHLAADDAAGMPICRRWRQPCCVAPACCCPLRLPHDVPYDLIDLDKCACQHVTWGEDLLGTGSQDEIDWAAQLPLCGDCQRLRAKATVVALP